MKKIKITHIFDKRAARLFKQSAYEKSTPEKTGLKVATQGPYAHYFRNINGVSVEHVLIQKKHLDEAKRAINWGLLFADDLMDCKSKIRVQIQMREALKNITMK